tara:strand:- start:63 stop:818 length:756 start_codon:yes stop_codon:yes gene_type:complete
MMEIIKRNIDALYFLGDTHGDNLGICWSLRNVGSKVKKAIIHVGDFGIGYEETRHDELQRLDKVNTKLIESNAYLFVVRGNHDDPSWFDNSNVTSNIIFLKDHTLLELTLSGKVTKVYCNGGSVSINRLTSTQGVDYWQDEKFTCPSDAELLEIPTDLDAIVTHNRPLGCHPTVFNEVVMRSCLEDVTLEFDLRKEQVEMKRMFDSIRERNNARNNILHYFGHYHWNHKERIGDIAHITLAKFAMAEYKEK